jgi:hypothetical protein
VQAAVEACKLLLAKMEPAKKGMTKEPTWEELVTASWNMHILTAIQYQYVLSIFYFIDNVLTILNILTDTNLNQL